MPDKFPHHTETVALDVILHRARNVRHTYVVPAGDRKTWRVQQMLVDPEEHNDWVAEFEVDLAQSRAASEPVIRLGRIGSLTGRSAG